MDNNELKIASHAPMCLSFYLTNGDYPYYRNHPMTIYKEPNLTIVSSLTTSQGSQQLVSGLSSHFDSEQIHIEMYVFISIL